MLERADSSPLGYQLLRAAERDAILTAHLREYLAPLGLNEITPRKWIDGRQPPVRRAFELRPVKGAGLKVCWGFSLDFVPHFSGGKVGWHRSDKAAMLDVIVDPKDLELLSFIQGAEGLTTGLRRVMPEAVSRAKNTWDKGARFEGMLEIIREIRERRSNRTAYENHTQLPLACICLCAKTGDVEAADRELIRCSADGRFSEAQAAKLKDLVRQYGEGAR